MRGLKRIVYMHDHLYHIGNDRVVWYNDSLLCKNETPSGKCAEDDDLGFAGGTA